MKTISFFLIFSFIQTYSFGQEVTISDIETTVVSKIIILIVLAIISIYTYVKWLNENRRTDP